MQAFIYIKFFRKSFIRRSRYTDSQWHTGDDRPFLKNLFAQINSGEFGRIGPNVLNLHRLSVSGYSVGAQMVR